MDEIGGLVLVPQTVDAVIIPVLAGGGIADGRGLAAMLALGAEGVVMGTRFMATHEAIIHDNGKEWMKQARESDTALIQKSIGSPARVAKNAVALQVLEAGQRGATLEEQLPLISGARAASVYTDGDVDGGIWSCGQSIGLIHSVPTVKEWMEEIVTQAQAAASRINGAMAAEKISDR